MVAARGYVAKTTNTETGSAERGGGGTKDRDLWTGERSGVE